MRVNLMKKQLQMIGNPYSQVRLNNVNGFPCRMIYKKDGTVILSSDGDNRTNRTMTVQLLLNMLNSMDDSSKVLLNNGDECLFLLQEMGLGQDKIVWLEGESDNLANELQERLCIAAADQMDEMDFYRDLMEMGVTPSMVGKALGEDKETVMQYYCECGLI